MKGNRSSPHTLFRALPVLRRLSKHARDYQRPRIGRAQAICIVASRESPTCRCLHMLPVSVNVWRLSNDTLPVPLSFWFEVRTHRLIDRTFRRHAKSLPANHCRVSGSIADSCLIWGARRKVVFVQEPMHLNALNFK